MSRNKKFNNLKETSFSKTGLVLFLLVFAAIGGYVILKSSAAWTTNLVQLDDGSCGRNLQVGSDTTATGSNLPTFYIMGDGGLSKYDAYIDGIPLGNFSSAGNGNVCVTTSTVLSDGTHRFTATETQPHNGNQIIDGNGHNYFDFIVDTVPPPAPSTPALLPQTNGGSKNDNITNFKVPKFTGTAGPLLSVQLYRDQVTGLGGARADASGNWLAAISTPADGTYNVSAVTLDEAGNKSAFSASTTLIIDSVLPSNPSNLCISGSTPSSISLSWTGSTDNVGMYAYNVYLDSATDPNDAPFILATVNHVGSPMTFTDNDAVEGISLNFSVAAVDMAGNVSGHTQTVTGTFQNSSGNCGSSSDTTPPTQPGSFQSPSKTTNSISLSWTASTDSGGSGLAGYKLSRNGSQIATIPAGTTTYNDTGLSPNTTYSYSLFAYDNASPANSSVVATLSVTTQPQAAITGDVNSDGHVDGLDVSMVLAHFDSPGTLSTGDANNNGYVDGIDLSLVLSHFGS